MKTLRLRSELKTRDVEIYLIKDDFYGEQVCYMAIFDFRRPSTLEDFPYLKDIEDGEDFSRENYIKVVFVSDKELEVEMKNELIGIAGGFLENKENCHWNGDFEVVKETTISELSTSKKDTLVYFENLILRHGLKVNLADIPMEKFNNLSQD